jgi:hypothetical protein
LSNAESANEANAATAAILAEPAVFGPDRDHPWREVDADMPSRRAPGFLVGVAGRARQLAPFDHPAIV